MVVMPRQLRIDYPGAIHHVMRRGDRRENIYHDDVDRQDFLKTLAGTCQKTDWQVHAYCLMSNHFHLVLETPNPSLVEGMHWGVQRVRMPSCTLGCKRTGNPTESTRQPKTKKSMPRKRTKLWPDPFYACARVMPSLCILAISVVRASPSLAPAPFGPPSTQLVAARAWMMCSRAASLSVITPPLATG